jgi:CRP-like cAMP-binding protein
MSDVSKVKQIGLFSNIDEKVLGSLAPVLSEEHFKDGQIIFNEGDPGDEIYFIFSGDVEIIKLISKEDNVSQLLSLLTRGEFFGEMALFDKKQRSATVKAKGDVTLLKLSCADFYYFLKNDAQIAVNILGSMLSATIKRLRETDTGFVTIYETGRLLASEQNIDKLLTSVLVKIMEVIPSSQRGFIAVWNEFSSLFELKSTCGYEEKGVVLKKDDGVIKWLKENKKKLVVEDAASTSIFSQELLPDYCGTSFIIQPLIHREELLGFFLISNKSQRIDTTRSQINLLSGIAAQIAPVIANSKKLTEEENRKRLRRAKAWE